MKKFNEIKVGECIFTVNIGKSMYVEKDEYGNIYNDGKIDGKIEIFAIHKKGEIIHFNPVFEYGEIKRSVLSLDINSTYNDSSFEIKQSSYPYENLIYFSDENECSDIQKVAALKEIESQEQSIIKYKNDCLANIKTIRERYYRVLNPSFQK